MKETLPLVSIITVNYNGKQFLDDCFGSLLNLNYPKDNLEIFMVDNGSVDGSLDYVRENFPTVKIIINSENNYAKANNLGIKQAKGDYVALINNDVKVDKDWLIELIKVITQDKGIAGIGSKILFMDGKINSVGHRELPNYYWKDCGWQENDTGQYDMVGEVNSVCGASSLYCRGILIKVGSFDEDFNMFVEDVDIGIRLRKAGYKIFYVPSSIIYHRFHGSIKDDLVNFYIEKNRLLFIAKHYPNELGKAIFGKGYFTVTNNIYNHNDIHTILPTILSKLLKHHKKEIIDDILPDLFDNLKKIINLEKDFLIQKISYEVNESLSKNKQIISKDNQLSQKETIIQEKNNQINKQQAITQEKEETISKLHLEIQEKNKVLVSKSEENKVLSKQISDFYATETFRYVVKPIWEIFDFLKKKRIPFVFRINRRDFASKEKAISIKSHGVCLAFFAAQAKIAEYKKSNLYNLKLTNDTQNEAFVIVELSINCNGMVYSRFTQDLQIQPLSSQEIVIDYNWHDQIKWYLDSNILAGKESQIKNFNANGYYSLAATLFNHAHIEIDRLNIFQKLIL